jgi:hypothetical protein
MIRVRRSTTLNRWKLPSGKRVATGQQAPCHRHKATEASSLWVCDQLTSALDQVSEAFGALGVAVGNGRRRRCAEFVCVER